MFKEQCLAKNNEYGPQVSRTPTIDQFAIILTLPRLLYLRVLLLAAMGLGALYLMHLLAQDYNKIRKPAMKLAKFLLTKRDVSASLKESQMEDEVCVCLCHFSFFCVNIDINRQRVKLKIGKLNYNSIQINQVCCLTITVLLVDVRHNCTTSIAKMLLMSVLKNSCNDQPLSLYNKSYANPNV